MANVDILFLFADRITAAESLFYYGSLFGRKKRQAEPDFCTSFNNCGNHSFEAVAIEDLTFTDEQKDFCQNDPTCLYDLEITGDEELAELSMETSDNTTRQKEVLSECPNTMWL